MLYRSLLRPLLFRLPAELAHEFAINSLSLTLRPPIARGFVAAKLFSESFGPLRRFGLEFSNPVGLAAGFDKNGVALVALAHWVLDTSKQAQLPINPNLAIRDHDCFDCRSTGR